MLLGCGSVQVCTAAMHYGYRIVEDMCDGLANWMDEKGYPSLTDFRGLSLPRVRDWKHLDLNYKIVARIHEEKCIGCDLCYAACWDGAHQCIHLDRARVDHRHEITVSPVTKAEQQAVPRGRTPERRIPRVDEAECVGCNLCALVCPVAGCITMERLNNGLPFQPWEQRST